MTVPYSPSEKLRQAERAWSKTFLGYWPYIGVGFVLAMLLPLAYTPAALASLVDLMASVIPSIDRLASISFAPQFTRSFGAMMWLLQPVFTLLAIVRSPRIPIRKLPWSSLIVMFLAVVVLVLLGILFPIFFFDFPAGYIAHSHGRGQAGLNFILQSRFGHATGGSAMFAVSSVSQVFVWRVLRDSPSLILHNVRVRFARRQTNDAGRIYR